ncbi:hypothetical protein OVA03_12805 [Asticcacaulis sp. SL142]|uniref:hypothetical protein n=1 Tax=Asticcacaulis sp. SL142 TaxID=2995155 RepID=UPI00226C7B11|nr:hypothetical protein [Asticcacaulis sp. SL142]WAC47576.1 hypothetical protein OVA03_12805 [Asticcacaulis sp. SL142]
MGGEWRVASFLVKQIAEDLKCQAACDLLMTALNNPTDELLRVDMLEAECRDLVKALAEVGNPIEHRAVAALALGGGLAEEQHCRFPDAIFGTLGLMSNDSHVIVTAHAGWKLTRNPMSLLLPLVWEPFISGPDAIETTDVMPPVQMVGGIPTYAVDQFTRIGGQVARSFIDHHPVLRQFMKSAGIHPAKMARVVGDLMFILEGGLVKRRAGWELADKLSRPHRPLPGVFMLGEHLESAMAYMTAHAAHINDLRQTHLSSYHQDK